MGSLTLGICALFAFCRPAQDPPGFWERETLLGDLGGARPALADRGVTFTLAFTGEIISCVSGGLDRDTGADLLLDGVLDADFEKLAGWTGGSARVNPMWLAGDGISDDVGDITLASNITGRGGVRVFEAWLQQSLFDDRLSLRSGILAADQEFAISGPGLLYFNSVFGGPVFITANMPWPIYPVGALGARVKAEVASGMYVQAAVFDGDPGTEDFNRSGLRVRLDGDEGVFAIAEAGWTHGETLPGAVKAGLFHHSADFPEFPSGTLRPGLTGGYLVFEQKLIRDLSAVGGAAEGGLDAFLRLGFAQEERALVSFGLDTGVTLTGLIPTRDRDVLGLGLVYARISRDFARSQADPSSWDHEVVLEATYKIAITPAWSFQPDFQYIVHPGGTDATPNAVVLGFRVDLTF